MDGGTPQDYGVLSILAIFDLQHVFPCKKGNEEGISIRGFGVHATNKGSHLIGSHGNWRISSLRLLRLRLLVRHTPSSTPVGCGSSGSSLNNASIILFSSLSPSLHSTQTSSFPQSTVSIPNVAPEKLSGPKLYKAGPLTIARKDGSRRRTTRQTN
ncbi:hypothetical protein P170DRAFT_58306 [Aspergillus steynii IBT 23096]|uniref:Uncharacterized protein n=1 Tax=Aspergillus steynii IBT 23096 TaxID=1392250 RepID=A0A2I2FSM6_9EURO|nr:uncharacterized protein P170DRAFT_165363 [Aspergillus steynii IBT 23096]XP_024698919.1 uncharacterized protein P170DRAFT_58306 [Aspergillus steynii IBT 23096]PLB42772.1 hypothetical protein P170DRAFT_165363 [Aspergillus steynii IBT 23096]PLB43617.1 hypothetical protein P170DRAFT_58306 [Aspergillus steynii IBT 23096]